jgi:hypothetical protein
LGVSLRTAGIYILTLLILVPGVLSIPCTNCGNGESLISIAIVLGVVILFLTLLSDRAAALYVTTKSGIELPMLKWFLLLIAGWILTAAVDFSLGVVEWLEFPRIESSVLAIYTGLMWTLRVLTSFWFVAFFYFLFMTIKRWFADAW